MRNRSICVALLIASITSATALAQDAATAQRPPRVELYFGVGPQYDTTGRGRTGTDPGWSVAFDAGVAVNVSQRVAVVIDNVSVAKSSGGWDYGFTVGPRIRFGGHERRLTGFAQALIGLQSWGPGWWVASPGGAIQQSDRSTALQATVAAGLDFRLSRRVSWRIVQVEQWRRFGDYGRTSTGVSMGVVFGLGGR